MTRIFEEPHDQDDDDTIGNGTLSFLILIFCLFVVGLLFWAGI